MLKTKALGCVLRRDNEPSDPRGWGKKVDK